MARSATDVVHDIINAAVVDAIIALRDASKGLPNALLRDVNAIHANTAFDDLPDAVRAAVATSVRAAFAKLQKDGYVVAEARSAERGPAHPESRSPGSSPGSSPGGGRRRPDQRPAPKGRPRR